MLGRSELWLLPAQDDMSCCGGLEHDLGGEELIRPRHRSAQHCARRRQSRAHRAQLWFTSAVK
jgi:hypothetical protein